MKDTLEPVAPPDQAPPEALLDEHRAAALLAVSPRTLQEWRTRGTGPTFVRIGARVRYCPRTLTAWVRSRRATVATSRKPKPVSLSGCGSVPPEPVSGLLARCLERRAGGGEAGLSPLDCDRLARALCAYVWHLRSGGSEQAVLRLLSPVGLACLDAFAEGGAA